MVGALDDAPEAYDRWYQAIGDERTGGVTLSVDDVRARRGEIVALAERHGVSNVRLCGAILDGPVRPGVEVEFLAEHGPGRGGLGFAAFGDELVRLLGHWVSVTRPPVEPQPPELPPPPDSVPL